MSQDMIDKIRRKWSKLNKYSVQALAGSDLLDLAAMLRETYGFSRLQAERECHEFQLNLIPLLKLNGPGRPQLKERRSFTS